MVESIECYDITLTNMCVYRSQLKPLQNKPT